MVSLTGDVATGRKIMEAVAPTIKRTHFELGGKAPVIVLEDADIAAAVEAIAEGGYSNAGQDCTAACRVYAHARIHDRLVAELEAAVRRIERPEARASELQPLLRIQYAVFSLQTKVLNSHSLTPRSYTFSVFH